MVSSDDGRIEHNQFVDSFVLFAQGLHALVRKFPEGLEWNSGGSSAPKSLQFSKRGYVGLGAAPPQPKNKIVGNKCLCEYQVLELESLNMATDVRLAFPM